MTNRPLPQELFEELHALTAASLSGEIGPDQRRRLEELLENPAAMDLYLNLIHETVTLLTWADHGRPHPDGLAASQPGGHGRSTSSMPGLLGDIGQAGWTGLSSHPLLFSLAAILAISMVAVIAFWGPRDRPVPGARQQAQVENVPKAGTEAQNSNSAEQPKIPKAAGSTPGSAFSRVPPAGNMAVPAGPVAILTGVLGARWNGNPKDLVPGALLTANRELRLDAGLAELTFCLGARVIVAAPAHLRLTSIDSLQVLDGKITVRADTERARGFVVKSPIARITDLGTEFGTMIYQARQTDLQIFQGMVEVTRNTEKTGRPVRLTAGQRMVMKANGDDEVPSQPADAGRFMRSLATAEENYQRWRRWSQTVRKDKDLVCYYDFEPKSADDRVLPNVAIRGEHTPGTIRGSQWAEGRWPGKSALCFRGREDRVHLDVPGRFPTLTLVAWVNIHELENEYNGLLMSDGWHEREGQVHWQLARSGRFDFGVDHGIVGVNTTTVYRSPSLAETDEADRWLQLAAVYDTSAGQMAFYVNGRQADVKPIAANIVLVPGACEIGNWTVLNVRDTWPVRNFRGRMDELLIFRRALNAAEVKNMYEEGTP
jgi:hypothetical protein